MSQLDLFESEIENRKGARIYISGDFGIESSVINIKLKQHGLIRDVTPSKNTNIVFIGRNPDLNAIERLSILKHDGFNVPTFTSKEDFIKLLKFGEYPCPMQLVVKDIRIDNDYIFKTKEDIVDMPSEGFIHPLYQKNIFIDLEPINYNLWQLLGNVGAYCYNVFNPSDIDYIWLSEEIINNLKNGREDSTISKIEKAYNESNAIKFYYQFIIGSDVLKFIKKRAEQGNDKASRKLLGNL